MLVVVWGQWKGSLTLTVFANTNQLSGASSDKQESSCCYRWTTWCKSSPCWDPVKSSSQVKFGEGSKQKIKVFTAKGAFMQTSLEGICTFSPFFVLFPLEMPPRQICSYGGMRGIPHRECDCFRMCQNCLAHIFTLPRGSFHCQK